MKFNLNDNIKPILAIMVVIFGFTYFFYCAIDGIKPDPQILIAVVGSVGTVLGFFFGSSVGSQKKDDTIASLNTPNVNSADTINIKQ